MIFKSKITVSLEIDLSKVSANRPCCNRPIVAKKWRIYRLLLCVGAFSLCLLALDLTRGTSETAPSL